MYNCKNVGMLDRMVRMVLGLAALILVFAVLNPSSAAGIAAAVFGVVMLVTALAGICPLYLPFNIKICKV